MKNILILITLLVFGGVATAKDSLTILNTGSKSGSYAVQMTTLSKDLSGKFDVDLKIPGDYCTAAQMMSKIKGPFIMPYANDYEAVGKAGMGCDVIKVEPTQVLRYDSTAFGICSMNGSNESFMKDAVRVGHSLPATVFQRSIQAINDSFGAKLTPVPYEGSGNTKTALYNGEVDYVLLSAKHGRDIVKNGGKCHYEFSNNANSDLVALGTLDKSNKQFIAGYHGVWLAYNMSDDEVANMRSIIAEIHADPNSGMYQYTNGGKNLNVYFDLSSDEIMAKWSSSVANLQE
tara:strand:+ start:3265 stop:4131 length:867 start_codon:yes stop_codon:yes gene_type:complete